MCKQECAEGNEMLPKGCFCAFCLSWGRTTANTQEQRSKQETAPQRSVPRHLGEQPSKPSMPGASTTSLGERQNAFPVQFVWLAADRTSVAALSCFADTGFPSSSDSLPSPHKTATLQVPWTANDRRSTPSSCHHTQ